MDPEDSEQTATAPPEGDSADTALAPVEDASTDDAQATAEPTPEAPAAASAPDAEPTPEPFDRRKLLEDPEIAAWLEERANAHASRTIQRIQQQQAAAQQQAQLNDLRARARQGDYEAERELAALKLAELDDHDRTTDPNLTTRVLDGLVKGFLNDARANLPRDVRDAVYSAPTVYDSYEAYAQFRLKDYVPKSEAARREAQAAEKERLRMAKAAPQPDLTPSAGIVEEPTGTDAVITAITERSKRNGGLSEADRATLLRLDGMAV